jgi:hypothetical protein
MHEMIKMPTGNAGLKPASDYSFYLKHYFIFTSKFKTRKMKRLLTILLSVMLTCVITAQSPFNGFFKPIPKQPMSLLAQQLAVNTTEWKFRAGATLTGTKIMLSSVPGQTFDVSFLSTAGVGVSLNRYELIDGVPYSKFGANIYVCYPTANAQLKELSLLASITGWQLVNAGFGWEFLTKKPFLALGLSYSFGQ